MRMRWSSLAKLAALAAVWTVTAGANSCSTGAIANPRFVTDLVLKNAAGEVRNTFARGEPITLELQVRNRSDEETVLQFSSGRQFDFIVVDAGSSRVRWQWSSDKSFIQILTELTFEPGETKNFSAVWNQVGADGQAVGAGNYEARGLLLFPEFENDPLADHQLGSSLEPFTIT
jgi:hypothetical protein